MKERDREHRRTVRDRDRYDRYDRYDRDYRVIFRDRDDDYRRGRPAGLRDRHRGPGQRRTAIVTTTMTTAITTATITTMTAITVAIGRMNFCVVLGTPRRPGLMAECLSCRTALCSAVYGSPIYTGNYYQPLYDDAGYYGGNDLGGTGFEPLIVGLVNQFSGGYVSDLLARTLATGYYEGLQDGMYARQRGIYDDFYGAICSRAITIACARSASANAAG